MPVVEVPFLLELKLDIELECYAIYQSIIRETNIQGFHDLTDLAVIFGNRDAMYISSIMAWIDRAELTHNNIFLVYWMTDTGVECSLYNHLLSDGWNIIDDMPRSQRLATVNDLFMLYFLHKTCTFGIGAPVA